MSELVIGLVSVSDRASAGVYKDEGIPSLPEIRAHRDPVVHESLVKVFRPKSAQRKK